MGCCIPSLSRINADGMKPFHETPKRAFCERWTFPAIADGVSNALKDLLEPDASVVTVSISTTRMASENYGYMAPIKAALDSSLAFLTKSFSRFSKVRFNAVAPAFSNLCVRRYPRLRRVLSLRRANHPANRPSSLRKPPMWPCFCSAHAAAALWPKTSWSMPG
jgi:enoyl-[acyl-carrier-protein] reductase (NADH)